MYKTWRLAACLLCMLGVGRENELYGENPSIAYRQWQGASRDGSSYLEAQVANLTGLRRGDCLIRIDEYADSAGKDFSSGNYFESRVYLRVSFDWDADKFAFVRIGSQDVSPYDAGKLTAGKRNELEGGFVFDQGKIAHRDLVAGAGRQDQGKLAQLLESFDVPQLNRIGFSAFGSSFRTDSRPLEYSPALLPGNSKVVEIVGPELKIVAVNEASPTYRTIGSWRWDSERMSITAWELDAMVVVDGLAGEAPGFREELTWELNNDVRVPIRIFSKQFVGANAAQDGVYYRTVDARLHWFSVNQTLDDKLFEARRVDSIQSLRDAADPKLLKTDL